MAAPNPQLISSLRELLGNLFAMYVRASGAHWNVEGALFHSLHGFFDTIVDGVRDSIDPVAEALRFHETYAPYTLSMLQRMNTIADAELPNGNPVALLQDLHAVNEQLIVSITHTIEAANAAGDVGLSNYLQDRFNAHQKYAWQIRAHLKSFSQD